MTRSQLVFGSGFIGLGVVLLLDRSGVVDAGETLAGWWPALVIVLGIGLLFLRPRHVGAGIFVTLMGGALLLWGLFGIDTVSLVWPLLLVGLGVWLLTRRSGVGPSDPQVTTEGEVLALFDDRAVRVPRGPLASRSVTTIFGDVDLDLRDATLVGRTTLQVVTIFGDVDIDVPDAWAVTTSGPQIFGSVRVAPPPVTGASQEGLHLEVVTIFGDVAVRRIPTVQPAAHDVPVEDLPASDG